MLETVVVFVVVENTVFVVMTVVLTDELLIEDEEGETIALESVGRPEEVVRFDDVASLDEVARLVDVW